MPERIDTQAVKGTRDFYPEDMRVREWLFAHWHAVARQFGFEAYDACVLESEDLYIRKAGDEITGQLYNFRDKGDRRVALRPEMTPTLARMILARGSKLSMPLRWYTIAQCFRYERMQRGRKREHFQWNMDVIGLSSVAAEVELMSAQVALLERLGLKAQDVIIRVSHRGILQQYMSEQGVCPEGCAAACIIVDKYEKIGAEATIQLLCEQGLSQSSAQAIVDLLSLRGLDQLRSLLPADNPGLCHLSQLLEIAEAAGIAEQIQIDCSVVRGLSYYTGTVWELFDASGDLPRAVAGGGRYDALMEHLGGPPLAMVGFGFGDVVILDILASRGLIPNFDKGIDDVVYPMKEAFFPAAASLASRLRREGRRVAVDWSERRFKHVIARAEQDGAQRLFILGEKEVERGIVKVRHIVERQEYEEAL